MKRFFLVLLTAALCFSLFACGKTETPADVSSENESSGETSSEDTPAETVYGREIAYELEYLETTPADFVEKYVPSSESGGKYIYKLEKDFTLTVKPGEDWETTEIYLITPAGVNYRLCYNSYNVHTEYARVENTSFDYSYTSYSSDGSHFVRTDIKYYDPAIYGWGAWLDRHYIDGETETVTCYSEYGLNSDVLWAPSGARFAYMSSRAVRDEDMSHLPRLIIVDASDGSYTTTAGKFYINGESMYLINYLEWSSDGGCLLCTVCSNAEPSTSDTYYLIVYDTLSYEILYSEITEYVSALPYCGIYNALHEFPFDWSKVTE